MPRPSLSLARVHPLTFSHAHALPLLRLWTDFSEFLWLQSNKITGVCPTQLGGLTGLAKQLKLNENSIGGQIPSQLGSVLMSPPPLPPLLCLRRTAPHHPPTTCMYRLMTVLLREFKLQSNSFTGLIPSQLGLMDAMTNAVSLFSNSLSYSLPTVTKGLRSGYL